MTLKRLDGKTDYVADAVLCTKDLSAEFDLLQKNTDLKSDLGDYSYEPIIFSGRKTMEEVEKIEVAFLAFVLGKIQGVQPVSGSIIGPHGYTHRLQLGASTKTLQPILRELRAFKFTDQQIPPSVTRLHTNSCKFHLCLDQARELNSLSLLGRITHKNIQQYAKKGIFTVDQLSYLYRQRRQHKRNKQVKFLHKYELQALAIRTDKIYIQELPLIDRKQSEYFLDIEGIPDDDKYYLIGLAKCVDGRWSQESFWADNDIEEKVILQAFLGSIAESPGAPIYHYGSYDSRAIRKLCIKYKADFNDIEGRLINVNALLFGRIYFPVYENSLKEIAKYLGISWSSPQVSGLQSLVWRYKWNNTGSQTYKELLETYNSEDCLALKTVVDQLTAIKQHAASLSNVNFADNPKDVSTEEEGKIYNDFNSILRWAHADYEKSKISFREVRDSFNKNKPPKKKEISYKRIVPYASKIVHVPRKRTCPKHVGIKLFESELLVSRTVIDIIPTRNGIKKVITKYVGNKSYCKKCRHHYYDPPQIRLIKNRLFGHGLYAWVIYQRLALRLSYSAIQQALEDEFNEHISDGVIERIFKYSAEYYHYTSIVMLRELLKSPFIHIDETRLSVDGISQYVWVFTDGIHFVFKLTATREAGIVSKILGDYKGVIVSDFFAGYDNETYRQQKCWVHLIRDINNDLWDTPYDKELEEFALAVRGLITPILDAVSRHGLKQRYLKKFEATIDLFYERYVNDITYESELAQKYQKRFIRYRKSLFAFIQEDGIPWNNNMAERAIRHLAVQRHISGHFTELGANNYLIQLGIAQACRFQNKSLLHFLMSGEKNVDNFKKRTKKRASKAYLVNSNRV